MKLKTITLSNCLINDDFKEVKPGVFQALAKVNINDLESIVLLEITEKHYKFLKTFDYKSVELNIIGSMQVRKNKKDIPFLFFKVDKLKKVKVKQPTKKDNLSKIDKKLFKFNWKETIKNFNYEVKMLDVTSIKFVNEEHFAGFSFNISKKSMREYEKKYEKAKIVVKPIEKTNDYELLIGWKSLILAKLLNKNKKIQCVVVDKSREELVNELFDYYEKEQKQNEE